MTWQQETPYVASVEVLVSMSDGSAHSFSTTPASVMDGCSFTVERANPPGWLTFPAFGPTPIVELTITVDGPDIRFIRQTHPAQKEGS